MNDEVNINSQNDESDRPPVDPKNKLYTVISLLIFVVLYVGWQLIKSNFTMTYALYTDSFTDKTQAQLLSQIELDSLPEGTELSYARLHRNFDSDTLYIALTLNEDFTMQEDFAELLIPYEYGNVVIDERFTVYPNANADADYVYGDNYVCIDNPLKSCLIYQTDDGTTAVFRTDKYDSNVTEAFKNGEKIKVQ